MANKKTVGELVYEVSADATKYNNVINKADQTAVQFGEKSKKSFNDAQKSIDGATSSGGFLKNMLGNLAGLVSLGAISSFFSSAVSEATNQQVADEKLANALENVKGAREGDFEMLKKQSSALQEVTRFSDDNIGASQAMLATFQLNGEAISALTPRLLDMTEAMANNADGGIDLQGSTIAIGKAMTSGIGVLSRYGVTFTEAQKKQFELGNQTEKLTTLTQVLDDNFKGTAETVGKTFAGRVEILKNKFGELKEDIGFALMPTLEALVGGIDENTKGMTGNQDRINTWGKAIYQGAMFLKSLFLAIKLVITAIVALGDTFVSIGKVNFAIVQDMFGLWQNFGKTMDVIGQGIGEAFKGNFSGAGEKFKEALKMNLTHTITAYDELKFNTIGWVAEMGDQFDALGVAIVEAVDAKGYKPVTQASVDAYRKMQEGAKENTGKISDEAKKLAENWKKLADETEKTGEKGTEAIREMSNQQVADLKEVEDKIKELVKELAILKKEYDKSVSTEETGIAEKIIAEKNAIEDLRKKLTEMRAEKTPDNTAINELQAEIDKRQKALEATQPLQTELAPQIAEATRRAGLTDLERAIEDYTAKKAQMLQEYNDKKADLEAKLVLENENKASIVALYQAKQDEINAIIELGNQRFKDLADNRVKITEDEVSKQIKYYNQLAQAIANAKSAKTSAELATVKYSAGGYVPSGGEVHAGEYVIPANMVAKYGGLISALEGVRTGASNNNTVNNNITMNNAINEQIDMDAVLKNMSFELNK